MCRSQRTFYESLKSVFFNSLQTNALDQFIKTRVIAQGIKTWFHFKQTHPRLASLIRFLKTFERLILVSSFGVHNRALEINASVIRLQACLIASSRPLKHQALPA